MINEATLRAVKYGPEMLGDSRRLANNPDDSSWPVLDLRRFGPKWLQLTNIEHERGTYSIAHDVRTEEMIFTQLNQSAGWLPIGSMSGWYASDMRFHAAEYLSTAVKSDPGWAAGMAVRFNLWAYEPTVADKLARGLQLSPAERETANRLGLRDTVQKGLLPMPFDYAIMREYPVLNRVTYSYASQAQLTAGTTIEPIRLTPRPGEFLVIRSLSVHDNGAATFATVSIDRDEDVDYLSLDAYGMADWHPLRLFVPSLKEIRVKVSAPAGGVLQPRVAMQVDHVRLTNIHRVRFGLVSRDEVPGELWDKVKGGVL